MAGWLAVDRDNEWTATGWLFDWVIRYLISAAGEAPIAVRLHEIHDAQLGMLNVDDFPPAQRDRLLHLLAHGLTDAGSQHLPAHLGHRDHVIGLLATLQQMAQATIAAAAGAADTAPSGTFQADDTTGQDRP